MSIETEHPSHHSFQNIITRPKDALFRRLGFLQLEDALLDNTAAVEAQNVVGSLPATETSNQGADIEGINPDVAPRRFHSLSNSEAIFAEWNLPKRPTHEDMVTQADELLANAVTTEWDEGLDAALPHYEAALLRYTGSIMYLRADIDKPSDPEFYLKIAGIQAKLASAEALSPYSDEVVPTIVYDEDGDIKEVRGTDRATDLFHSADRSLKDAHTAAEGRSREIEARIKLQRAGMYALNGAHEEAHGNNRGGQSKIAEALNVLKDAKREVEEEAPELVPVLEQQITDTHDLLLGKSDDTLIHRTASNFLLELAARE